MPPPIPGNASPEIGSTTFRQRDAPLSIANALTVPFGATVNTLPSPATGVARSVIRLASPPIFADHISVSGASSRGLPPAWPAFNPTTGAAVMLTTTPSPAPSAKAAASAVSITCSGSTSIRSPARRISGSLQAVSNNAVAAAKIGSIRRADRPCPCKNSAGDDVICSGMSSPVLFSPHPLCGPGFWSGIQHLHKTRGPLTQFVGCLGKIDQGFKFGNGSGIVTILQIQCGA